ncbi:hypothetical protein E2C01_082345 [Portunus trituberculatus]|uniref:Uncharacterized protein n=1 Tax=Portunus trituberculatus TaxID=210409 RepID=A0A5B7IYZ5_PORTR|nr:hypothetical protein [Portunus trituberculatus]
MTRVWTLFLWPGSLFAVLFSGILRLHHHHYLSSSSSSSSSSFTVLQPSVTLSRQESGSSPKREAASISWNIWKNAIILSLQNLSELVAGVNSWAAPSDAPGRRQSWWC